VFFKEEEMKKSIVIAIIIGFIIVVSLPIYYYQNLDNNTTNQNIKEFSKDTTLQKKPNIIVVMVDDLEVGTMNAMLENNLMPNLQRFVINQGTEFTNSFVTTPLCCPSRSTFLTGQYAHNHGVLNNQNTLALDDNHTLATWLHDSGYRTGLVGKYLNGYGEKIDGTYIPPGWDSWKVLVEPYHARVYNYKLNENGIIIQYGEKASDYQTDVLARHATDFINESEDIDDDIPFFLEITPMAPHSENLPGDPNFRTKCIIHEIDMPFIRGPLRYDGTASNIQITLLPSFNETDISDKPDWIKIIPPLNNKSLECLESLYQKRIEAMRAVDDLLLVVINALNDNNELDNTVIIFTSDNGYLLGEHRGLKKGYAYEESIRVPLFISTPEYRNIQSSSRLVINNDLAPTILELAQTNADIDMDGSSLLPLLSNTVEKNWRDKFLIEYWPMKLSVTSYKMINGTLHIKVMTPDTLFQPPYNGIRTDSHVYIEYQDGTREFYDLKTDQYQLDNLYGCTSTECKEQINELEQWLSALKTCAGETCQLLENKQHLEN